MLLNTPLCDFGWQAPDFTLSDTQGNQVTLSEQFNAKAVLIMFISNHCPYVIAVAQRLAQDMQELQLQGINVVAVMSNDYHEYQADSPENMRRFAQKYGFSFSYLIDLDQQVGRAYGAVCTPDFFGLNNAGELQYRGRLDSAGMGDPSNRDKELVKAMLQIAETGQGPKQQNPSMGCSIKWR